MIGGNIIEVVYEYKPLEDRKVKVFKNKTNGQRYRRIVGGLAWPSGAKAGFGVIVAEDLENDVILKKRIFRVLAEVEERHLRKLLKRCGEVGSSHKVGFWYGKQNNKPAMQILEEVNRDRQQHHQEPLFLADAPFVDDRRALESNYLPVISERLNPKPKKSLEIDTDSTLRVRLAEFDRGASNANADDYPAIAALAYAVVHLGQDYHDPEKVKAQMDAHRDKYEVPGL